MYWKNRKKTYAVIMTHCKICHTLDVTKETQRMHVNNIFNYRIPLVYMYITNINIELYTIPVIVI